ncbi:MAG: patatin-like phospholipase family protein [Elainellaceae cyanobacterium]
MAKQVGLALGGGGARGWAHIGVIRALEAADIKIDYISGTSIGAFVGAHYAIGELDELEEFVRGLDWQAIVSYFDVVFPRSGLLDGDRVYDLLSTNLLDLHIDQTKLPFCCVATDLMGGHPVCLRSGRMADAVRASISLPGIFTPFQREGQYLGDGGLVNPVPVDVVREMGADVVVAVNLNNSNGTSGMPRQSTHSQPQPDNSEPRCQPHADDAPDQEESSQEGFWGQVKDGYDTLQDGISQRLNELTPNMEAVGPNIFDVLGTALNIMEQQIMRSRLADHPPDILIEPHLSDYSIFDFHQADKIIEEGDRQTREAIAEIRKAIG